MQIILQESCCIFIINVTLEGNFTEQCGSFFRFFYKTEKWFHLQNEQNTDSLFVNKQKLLFTDLSLNLEMIIIVLFPRA